MTEESFIAPDILLAELAQVIIDKKGFNLLALDIRGISTMTDYFLIAEGHIDRHVIALARAVEEKLAEHGERPICVEGLQTGEWIVVDCWHIVVHLFTPRLRDKYQLEKVWQSGEILALDVVYPSAESAC